MAGYTKFLPDIYAEIGNVPHNVALNAVARAANAFFMQSLTFHSRATITPYGDFSIEQSIQPSYQVTVPVNTSLVRILSAYNWHKRPSYRGPQLGVTTWEKLDLIGYDFPTKASQSDPYKYILLDETELNKVVFLPYVRTPGVNDGAAITDITNTNPAVITAPGHGFISGDRVSFYSTNTDFDAYTSDTTYSVNDPVTVDTFEIGASPGSTSTTGYVIKQQPVNIKMAVTPTRTATTIPDELYEKYYEFLLRYALGLLYSQPHKPWANLELGAMYVTAVLESASILRKSMLADHSAQSTTKAAKSAREMSG